MRCLLLVLMIALLPLRALVGDAMAMAMVNHAAHGHAQTTGEGEIPCPDHAASATSASEATPHGHHSPVADAGTGSETTSAEHAHTACDLCNGPAMTRPAAPEQALAMAHGMRAGPVERFISFEPQRGIKPPIS